MFGGGNVDRVRIVKGGTIGSTDRSASESLTDTLSNYDFGGPTDLWGETWTADDINEANFGSVLALTKASGNTFFGADAVWIKVYYTEASGYSASGSLKAGAPTVSGDALRAAFATGVIQAQLAAIVAEASRTAKAEGSPKAQDATVEGLAKGPAQEAAGALKAGQAAADGEAERLRVLTAEGALVGGGATADGAAGRTIKAEGDLASGPASLIGAATIFVQGLASGALKAGAAVVDGAAVRTAKAAGALVSGLAVLEGSSELIHKAIGVLKSGTAQASGAVVRVAIATGELVSGAAAIVGRLVINIIRPSLALKSEMVDVLALQGTMSDDPVRISSTMSDIPVALQTTLAPI